MKSFFRRRSLLQKFSLAAVALIVVIMIVVGTLVITYQRNSLQAEMEGNHLLLARNLAKDVVEPLVFMDPLRLDELVRVLGQIPECVFVAVIDAHGRYVAHTDRRMLGSMMPSERRPQFDLVVQALRELSWDHAGDEVKELFVPVNAGYEVVGVVTAGFSRNAIDMAIANELWGLKRYFLLVSAGVLLLGIWGAYGLARFLTIPVKRLKDKMELVQGGDLGVEVPNESLLNCWEAFNCELKDCPAHGESRCWTIMGTLCCGDTAFDPTSKIQACRQCIVYRESCGDEIGELVEVFNEMIKKLRVSIDQLEATTLEKSRLEKLSALGEMSMTVAHEIKNPLNAIRGAVSYLQGNFEGAVLQEFLQIIDDETKRLNEIVMSYLRFAKPTPLQLQAGDINAVMRDTVELIRQEATENNVEVTTSLDESIQRFAFDPFQMKQAFLNILVNAVDATQAGDSIRISTSLSDSKVHVMIGDTGIGMSSEVVPDIFKPFFTTKTRGSGLGLASVERIVKDHRGDVTVASTIGRGTEFHIILPLGQ